MNGDRSAPQARSEPSEPITVVFFGTPAFAVPTLERLASDDRFRLTLVVTQPDRPAGRGRQLEASPVKAAAQALGLPIYQTDSLRSPEAREPLVEARAELFVVAAFGLIFGPKTLAIPRCACVNLHASLLPRYRGASPIAAAILNGDPVAGVTLMLMDPGLDTGPMLATAETAVGDGETSATLATRLASLGAALAADCLPRFVAGELAPTPQPTEGASLTRPLVKADGWLRWSGTARELERLVRAMWPWPRAWTLFDREPLQVHEARVAPPGAGFDQSAPGTLIEVGGEPAVICGDGLLILERLQPASGKPMDGRSFLAGRRYALTQILGGDGPSPSPPLIVPVDTNRDGTPFA